MARQDAVPSKARHRFRPPACQDRGPSRKAGGGPHCVAETKVTLSDAASDDLVTMDAWEPERPSASKSAFACSKSSLISPPMCWPPRGGWVAPTGLVRTLSSWAAGSLSVTLPQAFASWRPECLRGAGGQWHGCGPRSSTTHQGWLEHRLVAIAQRRWRTPPREIPRPGRSRRSCRPGWPGPRAIYDDAVAVLEDAAQIPAYRLAQDVAIEKILAALAATGDELGNPPATP